MKEKTIGILGGMGPEATLDLYRRIIRNTPAHTDQEHLRVVIDSNPKIPDRNAALLADGEDPTAALLATAHNLEAAGADFIVVPCNAAHIYLPRVRPEVDVPILSIVDETIRALLERVPGARTVGLLASTAVVLTGLYAKPLEQRGIATVVPDEEGQQKVQAGLFAVKAGDKGPRVKADMVSVANALIARRAEALFLACTEIPLVLQQADVSVPVLDTLEVLAQAAVREARLGIAD